MAPSFEESARRTRACELPPGPERESTMAIPSLLFTSCESRDMQWTTAGVSQMKFADMPTTSPAYL